MKVYIIYGQDLEEVDIFAVCTTLEAAEEIRLKEAKKAEYDYYFIAKMEVKE